jgi:hypothetical protein
MSVETLHGNVSTHLDLNLVVVSTKHLKSAILTPTHNVAGVEHHGSMQKSVEVHDYAEEYLPVVLELVKLESRRC